MSRGLGKTERAALDALASRDLASVLEVAGSATVALGETGVIIVSDTTYRSFARALRSLAKVGLVVDLGRCWQRGARRYALPEAAEAYRRRTAHAFGQEAIKVRRPVAAGVEFIAENGGGAGVRLRKVKS